MQDAAIIIGCKIIKYSSYSTVKIRIAKTFSFIELKQNT